MGSRARGVFVVLAAAAGLLAEVGAGEQSADYPCWRGPYGSGGPGDSGVELVTDAKDARLLWVSEEKGLGVGWGYRGVGPENCGRCVALSSGYGGLTVAGDRGYFVHYVPSGKVVDEEAVAQSGDKRPASWAINADDVVLCLDAHTGRTLWKAVFPEKGLSHNWYREGTFTYACVAGEKVFTIGTAGRVYALDARTGKPLWESTVGKGAARCEVLRRERLSEGKVIRRQSLPFDSSPVCADGVVVSADYEKTFSPGRAGLTDNGLTGLDAGSGQPLWNIPNAVGCVSSPVRWVHRGKEYVIAVSSAQAIAVEPKTGRVLWEVKRRFSDSNTPAVCEDYLVADGTGVGGNPPKRVGGETGPICLRIMPEKAETVWELSDDYRGRHASPLIHRGYAYISGKAVELASGKVVGDKTALGGIHSPVIGDGRIFDETRMYVVGNGAPRPAGAVGVPKRTSGIETFTCSTLAQGCLFYRGRALDAAGRLEAGCFYCFDLRKTPQPGLTGAPSGGDKPALDADALAREPAGIVPQMHSRHQLERDAAVAAAKRLAAAERVKLAAQLAAVLDESAENWPAQVAACQALRLMGGDLAPLVPELVARMKHSLERKDPGLFELIAQTAAVPRGAETEKALALLGPMKSALRQGKPGAFDRLAAAFAGNGREAPAALAELLPAASEQEQTEIADALRGLGRAGAAAGPTLAELLKNCSREPARAVVAALPRVWGRDATAPLIEYHRKLGLVNPTAGRDVAFQTETLEALRDLGRDADAALATPFLVEVINAKETAWSQNGGLMSMAVAAYAAVRGKEATPTLIAWAKGGGKKGEAAMRAIQALGPAAAEAASALRQAMEKAKPDERKELLRVLAHLRPTNQPPRLKVPGPAACPQNGSAELSFTVEDDDDPLEVVRVIVLERPAHGSVQQVSPTQLVYKPSKDYTGPDRFKVAAEDPRDRSQPAECAITVGPAKK